MRLESNWLHEIIKTFNKALLSAVMTFLLIFFFPLADVLFAQTLEMEVLLLTGDSIPEGEISTLRPPVVSAPNMTITQAIVWIDSFHRTSTLLLFEDATVRTLAAAPHALPDIQESLVDLANSQSAPSTNENGLVLLSSGIEDIDGCCLNEEGLFLFDSSIDGLKVVARDRTPTPNGNGELFFGIGNRPALNESNQVAFWAGIGNAVGGLGNGSGIFRWDKGELTRIVRTGQTPPNGIGFFEGFSWPSINSTGAVAFIADISSSFGEQGIYRGEGDVVTEIVRSGDTLPPDWEVRDFTPFTPAEGVPVNAANQVAFLTEVADGFLCCFEAVYLGDGQTTTLITYAGQPLGREPLTMPRNINNNLTMNSSGQILFTAGSSSPEGIFLADSSGPQTIALEDDPVPGTVTGSFKTFEFRDVELNEKGDVAFKATFQNGGVTEIGLFYFSDRSGLLPPLVQTNSPIAGSRVTGIEFVGTDGGTFSSPGATGLDDNGNVTFLFELADGRKGIGRVEICEATSNLEIINFVISQHEIHEACNQITVSEVTVIEGGKLGLRAGSRVVFESGFRVESGGKLEVSIQTP